MINAPVSSLGLPGAWSELSRLGGALSSCLILYQSAKNLEQLLLPLLAFDASTGQVYLSYHTTNSQC